MTKDQETITLNDLRTELSPAGPQFSLLIYHRQGAEVLELDPGDRRVIGRAAGDVVIDDPSLSRRHAAVELVDDQVFIEDLGSKNGTRVNGARIERIAVDPGDDIVMGGLPLSLNRRLQARLERHDALLAALEQRVVRARLLREDVALIFIRAADPSPLYRWHPHIGAAVQPGDLVARYGPGTLEVLLSGVGPDADSRVRAMIRAGGGAGIDLRAGYAVYPEIGATAEELVAACRGALEQATGDSPARRATAALVPATEPAPIVASAAMEEVFRIVKQVALATIPVLIQGETGTGNEIVARAIHHAGPRRDRPLRCINCGAIPSQLVESALFGHERGAFTGADARRKGLFEEAHTGTVLLDEIGELSPAAQAALLRVLESGRLTRVGSSEEIAIDVRIIAATHRNLEKMCEEGSFRTDLLFRLNAMTLQVPPLRDRPEEIDALAAHFLRLTPQLRTPPVAAISPPAMTLLGRYRWPGNIRELRNVIERAVVIARSEVIDEDDLSDRVRACTGSDADDEVTDFKSRIQRYEAELILDALRSAGWNQSEAARQLNMPLRTMVRKISGYGLKRRR